MNNEFTYHADVQWTQGRSGVAAADKVVQRIDFSAPVEFQGEEDKWSPEELFLAAVASCYVTTFSAIAEFSKFSFEALRVKAQGKLVKAEGGMRFGEVLLYPELTVADEPAREKAIRLLEKTERACLIARSIDAPVRVYTDLRIAEPAIH